MKKNVFIACILAISMQFCIKKKVPESKLDLGLDYYPTTSGKYVVYDVDSIVYTEIPKDTLYYKYRIKEKLSDTFTDNLGQPAIRLERYIKTYDPALTYDKMTWTMKEVWMINATQNYIQVVENNVRFTKLVFPVLAKKTWNGNAANNLGDWQYSYTYLDNPETVNQSRLEQVLEVEQKEFRTLISYQHYQEKYARGIGLVYREITDLLSNNIVPGKSVENRIESGIIYKQTLVTYGYE